MNQLSIDFDPTTLARRSDPATSKAAARRVREFAAGQCATILATLRQNKALGAEQIADITGIESYAVRKRLADLEHASLARPLPQHRETRTGRNERLWEAY